MSRLLLLLIVASVLFASDEPRLSSDSVRTDTLAAVATDSTASNSRGHGAWYFPLVVIAATGGLFVLLFTTRSK